MTNAYATGDRYVVRHLALLAACALLLPFAVGPGLVLPGLVGLGLIARSLLSGRFPK